VPAAVRRNRRKSPPQTDNCTPHDPVAQRSNGLEMLSITGEKPVNAGGQLVWPQMKPPGQHPRSSSQYPPNNKNLLQVGSARRAPGLPPQHFLAAVWRGAALSISVFPRLIKKPLATQQTHCSNQRLRNLPWPEILKKPGAGRQHRQLSSRSRLVCLHVAAQPDR